MNEFSQITEFGKILLFIIVGLGGVSVAFIISKIIAPNNPTPEKLLAYECGEEPTGNSWLQFNSRFYVIALVFLLFDVEMIFVFPWAVVYSNKELIAAHPFWGWLSFSEMMLFIGILLLGLVYVWKKKDLNWIKPTVFIPENDQSILLSAYADINLKKYQPKEKSIVNETNIISAASTENKSAPKFKPRFKAS